jgi:molybdate transport system substrate-binding protein
VRPHTAALAALIVLFAGCGGSGEPEPGEARGEVVVSAASSLTDAFVAMESAFEEANPGTDVVLNLGGSSALREQILQGAPVDVFASADTSNMAQVVDADMTEEAQHFAGNELLIVVPAGNPAGIIGLEDFSRSDLILGLCAAPVPCGALAREALSRAGVMPAIDTAEPSARALVTKIAAGELDAGIVYATDVMVAGVEGVAIPEEHNVSAEYLIATLTDAPNRPLSEAFVALVLSGEGRSILAQYGFSP